MNRLRQEAIREEMVQADKASFSRTEYKDMEKIPLPKWRNVKLSLKSQTTKSFNTEEEIQKFLADHPELTINQRFGFGSSMINVEFYERAYGEVDNSTGYNTVRRWLTDEEVVEYLKDPKATL